ncbi:MAG: YlqD family protein [Candidatus Sericytochromatia bacterium]|uniref:YlqD family protein n=1 Tax=Candidatus Tanganyikabacteria bacterium TaxID=2961651 RepID=A0A938BII1_9BACT|nr:YlqD family protein [Candidatus Tanganyikabacteria bacterium]
MPSLSLRRQVLIKAIVTDQFKAQATAELQAALAQVDEQFQQLEFQAKRAVADLEKKAPDQVPMLKAQIDQDRGRLLEAKNDLMQKLTIIGQLDLNQEFVQGNVDNFVDVSIGDNLYAKLAAPEIIVKDGVVVEIRAHDVSPIARV